MSLLCPLPSRPRRPSVVPPARLLLVAALAVAALTVAPSPTVARAEAVSDGTRFDCAALDIHALGAERLEALTARLPLTVELDDRLVACAQSTGAQETETLFDTAKHTDRPVIAVWRDLDPTTLFLVRRAHPQTPRLPAGVTSLAGAAGHELVRADGDIADTLRAGRWPLDDTHPTCRPTRVRPLLGPADGASSVTAPTLDAPIHIVAVRQTANRPARGGTSFPPAVAARVQAVDAARWLADVETLAGWNRYSFGSSIDLARDWLLEQFTALGLAVSTETFGVAGTDTMVENVFGLRVGTTRPEDLIIVGGHYDSTSQAPSSAAPGAEDNASGCAGVVELARVLAPVDTEASVLFVCYAGEEQGLYGSADHASSLVTGGDDDRVVLMLNMDMIGFSADADLDLLLETEDEWAELPPVFEDAAATFTDLRTVVSFFAFGSDHVPYLDRGMPALLTIENDWDVYPDYHRTTDLPDRIVESMGRGVLRTNAAVLGLTAGVVDPSLILRDGFESGDLGAWSQ